MPVPHASRLATTALADLPSLVQRPRYKRADLRTGIVHLGIGAFHRGHQASYFEHVLNSGDMRWGSVAASLRSPKVRDQMMPQGGLYTLVERDGSHQRVQVVGGIQSVLVGPEAPEALIARLAQPETHVVTLTITEKGYKLDPLTGRLNTEDADIGQDLADLSLPRTAPGFLVAALARRRQAGLSPFTAISCDNLPDNGHRLAAAVIEVARAHDPALADWVERYGAFPTTMVDRIVPATDASDIAALAGLVGYHDEAMVKTEPFTQWVIEDRFAGERPDLAAFGVQMTANVAPWEVAKLRLLNGAHSGIAYLGGLAGVDYVHQMVGRPAVRSFVESLWNEVASTLSPPEGFNVAAYRSALMQRFANPTLQHRNRQIAMDGSQKLPQRLLATIVERRRREQTVDQLALAVAAWMRWQDGVDDAGVGFEVDDPLASLIAKRLARTNDATDKVAALLTIEAIFPPELAADEAFRALLAKRLGALQDYGALFVLEGAR